MGTSFLLVFREVLEAVVVVGIMLGYLRRTGRAALSSYVWIGVGAGVAASIAGAVVFEFAAGGFEGAAEQWFEAATRLAGAMLITTAVLWISHAAGRGRVESAIEERVTRSARSGLALLAVVSVLREGVELTLFLAASDFAAAGSSLAGALLGFAAAAALGMLVFTAAIRVNLRALFAVTNALLLLFAAGLVAGGLHELAEVGAVPPIVDPLWNVNPPVRPDGSFPMFHEQGMLGSILRGLFGWNGDPTAVEVIGWAGYLAAVGTGAGVRAMRAASRRRAPSV